MQNKAQRGATATEYIIIVSLIAIALIGVMMSFGTELSKLFDGGRAKLSESVASTANDGYGSN